MPDQTDLVNEIRAVRRRLWEEHGGTIDGLFEWLRSLEARHPEKMASPGPRRLTDEEIEEIVRMTGG